jgi:IS5 family transposase
VRLGGGSSALGDAVARPRDDRQKDLLRPALEEIIDLGHPLVRLAREIDWGFLDRRFASVCTPGPGQPGLPTRLVAGLLIVKHMHNLSDEVLCARWLENPYYQFFCGELSFCHRLPFDRSSLTHWRQRLGEEQLVALIQESLSVAHKTGALATRDLERVVVDTTVQPKAIAHPTDARLCYRALEKLVDLARRHDVPLRQSYRRVAKRAALMVGRYTHAHQFKRARRALKFLRIRLGRVIRDIRRKSPVTKPSRNASPTCSPWRCGCVSRITGGAAPSSTRCTPPRSNASAKAKPGRRTSSAARACPCESRGIGGDPGHQAQKPALAKAGGYRGHNHAQKFRVWISGQVRRVTAPIRREMRRRAAVEPVIGT